MTKWTTASLAIFLLALTSTTGDETKQGLANTFSAGVTLNDGNTESMQINAALLSEGEKKGTGSIRMGIEGNYGESTVDEETEKNAENAKAFLNVKNTLTEMTFISSDLSALYDDIARIDYRVLAGISPGLYLIKNEKAKLSVEAGVAYIWEEVDSVREDYMALRVAQRFDYAFSDTSKIWESVEYLPKAEDLNRYLVIAELGTEAALNAHMSLRMVLQDRYDSEPGAELEHNDLTLISAISIRF